MVTTVRALLIEDSQADATLIKISLSECIKPKIHVDHRTTMSQGLEFLKTQTGIDVVLLDLSLPDATGEQTVTMVQEATPHIPIVIMTGHDDPEYAEKMLSLGAQDYIVKGSFDGSTVSRAIRYSITRMQQSIERDVILRELREAVDSKIRMLGILAHDLRNPLGAISGWVELVEMLEGDKISELVKKQNVAIAESADSMISLIKDVLDFAVVDAGIINIRHQEFDLYSEIEKAREELRAPASQKNIKIGIAGEATHISGDKSKIRQVVGNLVANAIKFSHENGEIEIYVNTIGDNAQLRVSDHGIGIPPNVKEQLFKPFCNGQKGTASEHTSGLGLYICMMIVSAHNGTIDVDSTIGGGTTFIVNVPVRMNS